jgi:hypothetical protein
VKTTGLPKSPFGFPFRDVKEANTAMTDDAELLRRYAATRSEPAFAELVQRHLAAAKQRARHSTPPFGTSPSERSPSYQSFWG